MEEPVWVSAIRCDDFAKFEQLFKAGKVDFLLSKYPTTHGSYTPLGFAVWRGACPEVWVKFMVALGADPRQIIWKPKETLLKGLRLLDYALCRDRPLDLLYILLDVGLTADECIIPALKSTSSDRSDARVVKIILERRPLLSLIRVDYWTHGKELTEICRAHIHKRTENYQRCICALLVLRAPLTRDIASKIARLVWEK